MLSEHLSQQHDRASRRASVIEAHIGFIRDQVSGLDSVRVLDLACGPSLYLHRLSRCGYRGFGIDCAPAAIRFAREVATREHLDCRFEQADLRSAGCGDGYSLVLLIYGQFNVFTRQDARHILTRVYAALAPGRVMALELQTPDGIRDPASQGTDWTAADTGLFMDRPHVLLHERSWDEGSRTATERWYVIDTDMAVVDRYALSTCSYEEEELRTLLVEVGFEQVATHPSLTGDATSGTTGLFVVTASRGV